MGKLTTYTLIISGILVISYFAGIIQMPSVLLDNMKNFSVVFYVIVALLAAFIIAMGASAIQVAGSSLGGFRPDIIALMASGSAFLGSFSYGILSIYSIIMVNLPDSYNNYIAMLVLCPLMILWGITAIEWYRGLDQ